MASRISEAEVVLLKVVVWGLIGLLIEVFFTGIKSAVKKPHTAEGTTYLWMLPIYGIGSILFEYISHNVRCVEPVKAVVLVVALYVVEFTSGAALRYILGRCPWDYNSPTGGWHKMSIRGLVRVDYVVWWYILSLSFVYIYPTVNRLIEMVRNA